jgi:hypothetical protein
VFDVTSTGEVIVPIAAKLRVGAAALFAVTVERPAASWYVDVQGRALFDWFRA